MNKELKFLLGLLAAFLGLYFLPMEHLRFQGAILEAMHLVQVVRARACPLHLSASCRRSSSPRHRRVRQPERRDG
jgi:hypothetical protein